LLPSEIAVRYLAKGYKAVAITDHADYSNIKTTIEAILNFTRHWPKDAKINVLPGIELTHLPLEQFEPLAKYARCQGIKVIVGHGETLAEPVIKGTNLAAIKADIDILAHPGLITDKEAELAKEKGIFLEITARQGHRDTNTHVVEQALKYKVKLILNSDSHQPQDILEPAQLKKIALNVGLSEKDITRIYRDTEAFIKGGE
jgi:histidinol phosphatase-like PHP family hydrolase